MALNIKKQINEENGFCVLKLNHFDLGVLRDEIENQWYEVLKKAVPKEAEQFREMGMVNYHVNSQKLNHSQLWPKSARILPQKSIDKIRSLEFVSKLTHELNPFDISDEDNVGREEIYWRLVRPNMSSDVGPLHADRWFWDLGHGTTPKNCTRVKIWIPIYCEPGLNGLRLVPGSHKKQWKFHGEHRDGMVKPQIDEKETDLNIQLMHTSPGDAIVFNDNLLHGGAINNGQKTRVSCEFTMFVKA